MMSRVIYFVTSNRHKFQEIYDISKHHVPWIEIKMREDVPKLEIQSHRLEEIALFAAENAAKKFDETFIIEEAGLFVKALNGFPGPYSSYVFKTIGCTGILKLLQDQRDRSAEFRSVLVLHHRGFFKVFIGTVKGLISYEERGSQGFGFDPIFIPQGHNRTFAEMTLQEKNNLSHRGKSTRQLIKFLKTLFESENR